MAYLHEEQQLFKEAIDLVVSKTGISSEVVEKDYYVTMILRELSKKLDFIVQEKGIEEDVVVETFRAGGAGGQHINKTESAIRLKHIPTGITCECQDQRSQIQNKQKAMDLLRKKITQNYKINAEKNLKKQTK